MFSDASSAGDSAELDIRGDDFSRACEHFHLGDTKGVDQASKSPGSSSLEDHLAIGGNLNLMHAQKVAKRVRFDLVPSITTYYLNDETPQYLLEDKTAERKGYGVSHKGILYSQEEDPSSRTTTSPRNSLHALHLTRCPPCRTEQYVVDERSAMGHSDKDHDLSRRRASRTFNAKGLVAADSAVVRAKFLEGLYMPTTAKLSLILVTVTLGGIRLARNISKSLGNQGYLPIITGSSLLVCLPVGFLLSSSIGSSSTRVHVGWASLLTSLFASVFAFQPWVIGSEWWSSGLSVAMEVISDCLAFKLGCVLLEDAAPLGSKAWYMSICLAFERCMTIPGAFLKSFVFQGGVAMTSLKIVCGVGAVLCLLLAWLWMWLQPLVVISCVSNTIAPHACGTEPKYDVRKSLRHIFIENPVALAVFLHSFVFGLVTHGDSFYPFLLPSCSSTLGEGASKQPFALLSFAYVMGVACGGIFLWWRERSLPSRPWTLVRLCAFRTLVASVYIFRLSLLIVPVQLSLSVLTPVEHCESEGGRMIASVWLQTIISGAFGLIFVAYLQVLLLSVPRSLRLAAFTSANGVRLVTGFVLQPYWMSFWKFLLPGFWGTSSANLPIVLILPIWGTCCIKALRWYKSEVTPAFKILRPKEICFVYEEVSKCSSSNCHSGCLARVLEEGQVRTIGQTPAMPSQ